MSSGNHLTAAHNEWADRPADERYWNLRDMRAACVESRRNSREHTVNVEDLRVFADGSDVKLVGRSGNAARMTHHAFGQVSTLASAPASYLRTLPPSLAADALNVGLAKVAKGPRNILFRANETHRTARAILSDRYDRVWDDDVCGFLEGLTGWRAPAGRAIQADSRNRPATADDILDGQIDIAPGDLIGPAGLYASDHDMFAFLVAPDRVIDDGTGGALMRGIMVRNSEVGDASLSFTFFLMQAVCGNHIVWNASGVHAITVRHVGSRTMRKAFRAFEAQLATYANASDAESGRIRAARSLILGNDKESVVAAIVKYAKGHSLPLGKNVVERAFDTAEKRVDWYGDPCSLWGVVAGLTENSQHTGYADDRAGVDRAAGKLLDMAF